MSFEHVFVNNGNDELVKIDNSSGSVVNRKKFNNNVGAVGRDKDGYVYASISGILRKFDPSDISEVWSANQRTNSRNVIKVGGVGGDVYGGGSSEFSRIDKDTGNVLWSNYLGSGESINDMTTDGEYMYAHSKSNTISYQIDPSSGSNKSEVEIGGYLNNTGGFAYYNGIFHISNSENGSYMQSDGWDDNGEGLTYINNNGNVEVDESGVFLSGYGEVIKLDFSGNEIWTKSSGLNSSYVKYMDVSPDSVWIRLSDGTYYRLNPQTGDIIWSLSSTVEYALSSIGGYPALDMYQFKPASWYQLTQLSGSVNLNSAGVTSAEVYLIDTVNDRFGTKVTTDSSGNWTADVRKGPQYHVVCQYTDDSGEKYNTQSYPYIQT